MLPIAMLPVFIVGSISTDVTNAIYIITMALGPVVFLATVVAFWWVSRRLQRHYIALLDEAFAILGMAGHDLPCGGHCWTQDNVSVSLTNRRSWVAKYRNPHLEIAIQTPLGFEAEFTPTEWVLTPATCATLGKATFSGDAEAARWLDDVRLRRIMYALHFGLSRLQVTRSGVTWRFTAAKAGLQPGTVNEDSLRRWLDDLHSLCASWSTIAQISPPTTV